VRAGRGPRLLHAITYRVKGHVSVDPAAYRDPNELAEALGPTRSHALAIVSCAARRKATALEAIDAEAHAEVEAALAAADARPGPRPQRRPTPMCRPSVREPGNGD
jgi:acetoin:2,6-dichlorophenolindophenol oxidoreductase subunit alpha